MYLHHCVRSFVCSFFRIHTLVHIKSFLSLALQFTLFISNFWTTFSIVYCIIFFFSLLVDVFLFSLFVFHSFVYCAAVPRQLERFRNKCNNSLKNSETFTKQPDWQTNNLNSFKCTTTTAISTATINWRIRKIN